MATSNENPFVFPGMGQANPDLSGNPLMASMEMMRQAWAGLAGAGGLAQSLPMAPPMTVEELDKRIAELKSVEGWLSMNLSMLSSTIQGMEVQRATINTLRSFVDAMSQVPGDAATGQSPLEAVLGIRKPREATKREEPAAKSASATSAGDSGAKHAGSANGGGAADTPSGVPPSGTPPGGMPPSGMPPSGMPPSGFPFVGAEAAQSASQAWWDMLQQQFKQLATATAATMPAAASAAAGAAAGSGAGPAASAPAPAAGAPRAKKTASTAARRAPAKAAAKSGRAPTKSSAGRAAGASKKPSAK